jgi:hypothetical protein
MRVEKYFSDVTQVCRKGHVITFTSKTYPSNRRPFCERCGAATLDACETCGKEIVGALVRELVVEFDKSLPPTYQVAADAYSVKPSPYCDGCGSPFPWRAFEGGGEGIPLGLVQLLRRFPHLVAQLRRRHEGRQTLDVKDEYDAQDLLHALLKLVYDDIRPEEGAPSRAARSSRMDLLLKDEKTVIELKHTRQRPVRPRGR